MNSIQYSCVAPNLLADYLDAPYPAWYHPRPVERKMAAKRTRTMSQRERRRMRIQQIVFVAIGLLALASIIISMIKY
jgi:hypothetical protein